MQNPLIGVPKCSYQFKLKHYGLPSVGNFRVEMEKGQVAYLRSMLCAIHKDTIGILLSDNFPAFDMFVVSTASGPKAKATIYGIQISSEKVVPASRSEHSTLAI